MQDLIIESVLLLERLSVVVATLHLFSNNETLDDVSTETIKYVKFSELLYYYYHMFVVEFVFQSDGACTATN